MPSALPSQRISKSKHCDKDLRNRIRWICEWEASQGHYGYHNKVFAAHNISRTTGYRILGEDPDPEPKIETRGRPSKTSDETIWDIEAMVAEHGWSSKTMNWNELAKQACNGEMSGSTIRRAMGTFDFHRCPSCKRGWLNAELAKARVDFADAMLQQRPHPQDWHNVIFSGEASWETNQAGMSQLVQPPGERYCRDCVSNRKACISKSDRSRFNVWGAVGACLPVQKSTLVFFDSGNTHGKMTSSCYINNVLEPIVKPWLGKMNFVLGEDSDTSWALGLNSTATRWRKEHQLSYYFNAKASLDLSPVHEAFKAMEERMNDSITPGSSVLATSMSTAWMAADPQAVIAAAESMPLRLQKCLFLDGQYIND